MVAKRAATIAQHNSTAEQQQRHNLCISDDNKIISCLRCNERLVIKSFIEIQSMKKEKCLLLLDDSQRLRALVGRRARYAQMRADGIVPLADP